MDEGGGGGERGDEGEIFVCRELHWYTTYIRAVVVLFIRRILQFDRDSPMLSKPDWSGEVELSAIYPE